MFFRASLSLVHNTTLPLTLTMTMTLDVDTDADADANDDVVPFTIFPVSVMRRWSAPVWILERRAHATAHYCDTTYVSQTDEELVILLLLVRRRSRRARESQQQQM